MHKVLKQYYLATGDERVPLEEDRRLYTPMARGTYAWQREYKKRTSVERVNSRLDVSFGFERHFIRRKKKIKARMGLALVVMLAMAVGWIESGEPEKMRSLVQPRAA
ncbi:MAG: transposase [Candidatus Omnitrophica bacterium]|nr:transposase [Candidatus Omnitrophota bacterium]